MTGEELRKEREQLNLSLKTIAKYLHISSTMVGNYEMEKYKIPNDMLFNYEQLLNDIKDRKIIPQQKQRRQRRGEYKDLEGFASIREQSGLTQKTIAKLLNINDKTLSRYEKGSRRVPENIRHKYESLLNEYMDKIPKEREPQVQCTDDFRILANFYNLTVETLTQCIINEFISSNTEVLKFIKEHKKEGARLLTYIN